MAEIMKNASTQIISGLAREKAINHILNVLDYDNSLCQFIKSHTDFSVGRVFSVVPTDVEIENIVDFSWGFGKGSDNLLPARILKTLKLKTGAFAVIDDVMGEPKNGEGQGACLANNNEVYHWIFEPEATELNLRDLIRETGVSWHFLCVIFEPDKNIDIKDCIARSRYDEFKNVVEVVIGAYDGEGYIHWSPEYIEST